MGIKSRIKKIEEKLNTNDGEICVVVFPKDFEPVKSAAGYVASYNQ